MRSPPACARARLIHHPHCCVLYGIARGGGNVRKLCAWARCVCFNQCFFFSSFSLDSRIGFNTHSFQIGFLVVFVFFLSSSFFLLDRLGPVFGFFAISELSSPPQPRTRTLDLEQHRRTQCHTSIGKTNRVSACSHHFGLNWIFILCFALVVLHLNAAHSNN